MGINVTWQFTQLSKLVTYWHGSEYLIDRFVGKLDLKINGSTWDLRNKISSYSNTRKHP